MRSFGTGVTPVVAMGVLPSSSQLPSLPIFSASTSLATPNVTGIMSVPSLSFSSSTGAGTAVGSTMVPAGSYFGEGLLPVPDKLVKKILKFEFIEMYELLPETWLRDEEESGKGLVGLHRRKSAPVTNILQWVQCFAAMVGVLTRAYPQMVPDLMAYQATIVRCYRDFEDLYWVQYDRMYRRQVAITKDTRWGRVDTTLYSKCFAGKARRRAMCIHCLSDNHLSSECPENPRNASWPWSTQQPLLENPSSSASSRSQWDQPVEKKGTCNLFNAMEGSKCTYNPCKFQHVCSECRGKHPRAMCPSKGSSKGPKGSQFKRPRLE